MDPPKPQYKLAVGAIFKNEGHCLKEWIEHYLSVGAEHFYLINDQSTDNYADILKPYIENNVVTLNSPVWSQYYGRQRDMYNAYVLPFLKQTEWLLMVDLDEFMWSPVANHLYDIISTTHNIGQIQVEHTLFGSSGYKIQPPSIIDYFIHRAKDSPTQTPGLRKYFVKSSYAFSRLNVLHATFVDKEHEKNNFIVLSEQYFVLNHYNCQSEEFWRNVKCTRGDVNEYKTRTMDDFAALDQNDVVDTRLRDRRPPRVQPPEYPLRHQN
jgi:hypothetical protein